MFCIASFHEHVNQHLVDGGWMSASHAILLQDAAEEEYQNILSLGPQDFSLDEMESNEHENSEVSSLPKTELVLPPENNLNIDNSIAPDTIQPNNSSITPIQTQATHIYDTIHNIAYSSGNTSADAASAELIQPSSCSAAPTRGVGGALLSGLTFHVLSIRQ